MGEFKAINTGVEMTGAAIFSFIDVMDTFRDRALKILAEEGIENVEPDKWYDIQPFFNALKVIADKVGYMTIFLMGKKVPDKAIWPPDIDTIEKALASIDTAYHLNYRGGEMGHYKYVKTGERQAQIICDNPFPCDFDRGIIEATAKKFKPKDSLIIKVEHLYPEKCRKKGGDVCTYLVKW